MHPCVVGMLARCLMCAPLAYCLAASASTQGPLGDRPVDIQDARHCRIRAMNVPCRLRDVHSARRIQRWFRRRRSSIVPAAHVRNNAPAVQETEVEDVNDPQSDAQLLSRARSVLAEARSKRGGAASSTDVTRLRARVCARLQELQASADSEDPLSHTRTKNRTCISVCESVRLRVQAVAADTERMRALIAARTHTDAQTDDHAFKNWVLPGAAQTIPAEARAEALAHHSRTCEALRRGGPWPLVHVCVGTHTHTTSARDWHAPWPWAHDSDATALAAGGPGERSHTEFTRHLPRWRAYERDGAGVRVCVCARATREEALPDEAWSAWARRGAGSNPDAARISDTLTSAASRAGVVDPWQASRESVREALTRVREAMAAGKGVDGKEDEETLRDASGRAGSQLDGRSNIELNLALSTWETAQQSGAADAQEYEQKQAASTIMSLSDRVRHARQAVRRHVPDPVMPLWGSVIPAKANAAARRLQRWWKYRRQVRVAAAARKGLLMKRQHDQLQRLAAVQEVMTKFYRVVETAAGLDAAALSGVNSVVDDELARMNRTIMDGAQHIILGSRSLKQI